MNTLSPRSSSSSILAFVGLLLIIALLYSQYNVAPELSFKSDRPVLSEHYGEQLELPFEDIETIPEPEKKPVTPAYSRRYDEERRGTRIIYAFRAPLSGEYLIPGCYGKPNSWKRLEEGKVLKIGRHWNPSIKNCNSGSDLQKSVRKKRYGSDKKFPLGKIKIKIHGATSLFLMDIQIIDCFENMTEGECEVLEKNYILQMGGPNKLPLNCCCR